MLNAIIDKMNEQHTHFDHEMRDNLLHEIDPSRPFPRLEANLHDDCESSLPLESNNLNNARTFT